MNRQRRSWKSETIQKGKVPQCRALKIGNWNGGGRGWLLGNFLRPGCSGNWSRAETWGRPMGPGVNEPRWAEVNPHTLGFNYYYRLKTVTSTFSALTFFLQHSCQSYTIPCNSPNKYFILNMSKIELSLNLKPVFSPVFTISNGDTTIQSGMQC